MSETRIDILEGWRVWIKDLDLPVTFKTIQQVHEMEMVCKQIQIEELEVSGVVDESQDYTSWHGKPIQLKGE